MKEKIYNFAQSEQYWLNLAATGVAKLPWTLSSKRNILHG